MGAWGLRNFENDDALDWVLELEQSSDTSVIDDAFKLVIERDDEYLESPDACRALAAAEIVAASLGKNCVDLPDEARQWINKHGPLNLNICPVAIRAIHRIKTSSELKELWDESDSKDEWQKVITDLEMRLMG